MTTPLFLHAPVTFILLLILYNICYMPTMSLANSLSFHNIQDQEKEFPIIRTFGTVGWIFAGLIISFILGKILAVSVPPEQTAAPIRLAATSSILLRSEEHTSELQSRGHLVCRLL